MQLIRFLPKYHHRPLKKGLIFCHHPLFWFTLCPRTWLLLRWLKRKYSEGSLVIHSRMLLLVSRIIYSAITAQVTGI